MEKILNLGRYIFPLSFLMYVGLHIGKPEAGVAFVPDYIPFPLFWNYLTAGFIVAFIISALTRKYDGLAYTLMAVYVLLMALLVHLPRAMGYEIGIETMMTENLEREKEIELVNIFRNSMVTGALLGFAKFVAKDKRIVA
jgi:hypothetical protein